MLDGAIFQPFDPGEFARSETFHTIRQSTQVEMEKLFSKYQLHQCIAREFKAAGFPAEFIRVGIPANFGIDLLVQISLHIRANLPTMVGLLRKHFMDAENPSQACTDMLLKAAEEDVLDWSPATEEFVAIYFASKDVQDKLDQFQYPLPMVEKPKKVQHNREYGYKTIKKSVILKDNHIDDDVCLDHINRANQIPYKLNTDVVAFVQNQWKNLDKKKEDETTEDFEKRLRAFEKYDRTSKEVLAGLMIQGDKFWLTHRYDKRGRTYCQGYHVTYQGNDWNKACIEFANGEPLNDN